MGGHWAAVMGGAQYQAKCLLDEMVKKDGFEIFYLARVVDPAYQPKGYKLIQIAKHNGIRRYGFFFDARKLTRLLKKIKPDVIYQRGLKSYTGFAAYYAKNHGCKFIFHIASDYDLLPVKAKGLPWHLGPTLVEKKIGEYGIKHADYIIAQTRQQANLLKKNYGRNVTAVVPNFHPFPKERLNKDKRCRKVVWVANFKPVKRPEMFLKLAKDLKCEEGVEFIMVGRPGDPKRYKELHKQLSMTKNMIYLGERSIEEVNKILAGAHVFVNTSTAEGCPNTFIQAWMRKVPVVSVSVNTDGVFDTEEVGFCDGTYEYLRNAVKRLINDVELRVTMGELAQSDAFKHYSMTNTDELISLMQSV